VLPGHKGQLEEASEKAYFGGRKSKETELILFWNRVQVEVATKVFEWRAVSRLGAELRELA